MIGMVERALSEWNGSIKRHMNMDLQRFQNSTESAKIWDFPNLYLIISSPIYHSITNMLSMVLLCSQLKILAPTML